MVRNSNARRAAQPVRPLSTTSFGRISQCDGDGQTGTSPNDMPAYRGGQVRESDARIASPAETSYPAHVSIRAIMMAACDVAHISKTDLIGSHDRIKLAPIRHLVMLLAKECTKASHSMIALKMGDKNQATISKGATKARQRLVEEPDYAETRNAIVELLKDPEYRKLVS